MFLFHLQEEEDQEGDQRQQQHHDREFVQCAQCVHTHLIEEDQQVIGRLGRFILTAGQRVEEASHRPGVTPVHGRVRHGGDRHEEIEHIGQQPGKAGGEHGGDIVPPFLQHVLVFHRQINVADDGGDAHGDEDTEDGFLRVQVRVLAVDRADQRVEEDHRIAHQHLAAEGRIDQDDHHFQAHGGHQQRLVVRKADAEHEHGHV